MRRANLRRIGPLFAPYKARLSGLLLLIVISAALGVVPAFLLKRVLEAIGQNDTRALSLSAPVRLSIRAGWRAVSCWRGRCPFRRQARPRELRLCRLP